MAHWTEVLAERVKALKPSDWESVAYTHPLLGVFEVEQVGETVEIGETDYGATLRYAGRVNDRPIPGIPAGHLLVSSFSRNADGLIRMGVVVRRRRPWNEFLNLDGRWVELRDADGRSPYEPADLSAIP